MTRDLHLAEMDRALLRFHLARISGHAWPTVRDNLTGELYQFRGSWGAVNRRKVLAWSIALAHRDRDARDARIKAASKGAPLPLLEPLGGLQDQSP